MEGAGTSGPPRTFPVAGRVDGLVEQRIAEGAFGPDLDDVAAVADRMGATALRVGGPPPLHRRPVATPLEEVHAVPVVTTQR